MKQIEIFDSEQQKTFKLTVEDDIHDEIVVRGNLILATTLLEKQQAKENYVAAYKLLQNEESCSSESTSQIWNLEESPAIESATNKCDDTGTELTNPENNKIWSIQATKLLITLCKKYDHEFEIGIKKYVWNKISKEMTDKSNHVYTSQQCDTKFKGLKNMYKQVKKHNDQSGNNIKTWEYYDLMNDILFSKPEVNPVATCSSKTGLIVMGTPSRKLADNGNSSEEGNNSPTTPRDYTSSFMRKRKSTETAVERRHQEKLARQDRFLDLLGRLTTAVEGNIPQPHRNLD